MLMPAPTCAVATCPTPPYRRGYCNRHYQRLRKFGSVDATLLHDVDLAAARVCRNCGIDIAHKRSNAVYCSRSCKSGGAHQRLRATPEGKAAEKIRNVGRYVQEAKRRRAGAIDYYERNRELRLEYAREWRAQNPHRRRAAADRRAELMVTNPGFCPFDAAEWEALKRRHGYRCAYCGVRPEDPLEKDHVVPLTKGGRHAIANILPACGPCNRSKNDAFLAVWRRRKQAR
ncbi:HNH endonuclease [Streptomyces sp. NPDC002088]|uniref:HNH endonuclease n=1 Tax=Streptomyces sp. NPDC002088 TaxID=3154665 RepID=UPI00332691BF